MFGGTVNAVDNVRCHDSFNTVVVDSTLDSRVGAYVGLVAKTKPAVRSKTISPEELRILSEEWIQASKQGRIDQIYPGYLGESLVDGPKSDIFVSCARLATRMSDLAEKEEASGEKNALIDAIRAIELVEIVRFGSYEALFVSAGYVRRPLKTLKPNLERLTQDERNRLLAVQDPVSRKKKTQLLEQVSRKLKTQYALRYGKEMTDQDDPSYGRFLAGKGQNVAAAHFFGFDRDVNVPTERKK